MANIEKAVEAYRSLRDQKETIKERHKDELGPIHKKMYELETWLLTALNDQGADSIKTPNGTVYKSTTRKAKVVDWDACLASIKEHDLWHLLERRVSKTAVAEYVEVEGIAPPGVEVTTDIRVNIRKS